MKKLWIISMAAVLTVSFTACGAGNVSLSSQDTSSKASTSQTASSQPASSTIKVEASSVSDDLAGLQKYLVGNAAVSGTPENMRADMIGAKTGVRYKYGANGGKDNVTLELYEFGTANLNATAQQVISDVKSTGKFTVVGQKVDATLSKSGKYLMIYKNSATDDPNKAYGTWIKKLLTDFKSE